MSASLQRTKDNYLGYIRPLYSFRTCATTCPCVRHSLLKSCQRGQKRLASMQSQQTHDLPPFCSMLQMYARPSQVALSMNLIPKSHMQSRMP
ncbi:hypothetical protein EYC84_004788 [Monilinia fructicola]|uniref:Uncharacterized protein n=1 Tax=Monilinia fructicola TaxID=38448 RepID=A0A5M9K2B3_MONFR|nr:hypothetical protein EYC84_004788 [Monilinia fructicola]